MSDDSIYTFYEGTLPLLVSVPHDGCGLPAEIEAAMTDEARLLPDTDWYVERLYNFCLDLGASMIVADYSRYVVDLNRSSLDEELYPGQTATGLCPEQTFAGQAIYKSGEGVTLDERKDRVRRYWQPYHDRLAAGLETLQARHGYALLWDAHSIASRVPRLFDGELPELNIGSNCGKSCPSAIESAVHSVAEQSPYSTVVNGRFRGGYITRHYGVADNGCYALQLELSQRCYMDEGTLRYDKARAAKLIDTLRRMLQSFIDAAGTGQGREGWSG